MDGWCLLLCVPQPSCHAHGAHGCRVKASNQSIKKPLTLLLWTPVPAVRWGGSYRKHRVGGVTTTAAVHAFRYAHTQPGPDLNPLVIHPHHHTTPHHTTPHHTTPIKQARSSMSGGGSQELPSLSQSPPPPPPFGAPRRPQHQGGDASSSGGGTAPLPGQVTFQIHSDASTASAAMRDGA
jgi:hypothetical protein